MIVPGGTNNLVDDNLLNFLHDRGHLYGFLSYHNFAVNILLLEPKESMALCDRPWWHK